MKDEQIKVLIVDDDPKFLEIMKKNLESKNCFVKCVSSQKQALSLLINEVFHVAFIDCILHSGQGTNLIQEIRGPLGHSVEIIMMSGVIAEKSLSSYIDLGVCSFLSKPISDKEIEENLNQIKEKIIYGNNQNLLTKLFNNENSDIQKLKFLVSLKKAKDYEFFLYLNSVLLSQEFFNIEFQLNNKKHCITCKNGVIINYESENSEIFLNKMLSRKFITTQEKNYLKNKNQKECVDYLLNECILSSTQISDLKYDLLIETLKEIVPGIEIAFNIQLSSQDQISFALLDQNEYSDFIFLLLKQKFNNHLFALFDEEIMKKSLAFEDHSKKYLPEVKDFLLDLKSGMKLKGIYNKYLNDKNSFCNYLLYILLKGNVYFSGSGANLRYNYLFERYKSLHDFIIKTKNSEKFFTCLLGDTEIVKINTQEIKDAYLYFIRYNHPDKLPYDAPKELFELINKILSKVKVKYDLACNPQFKAQEQKKEQEKIIQEEVLLSEKKKICERYLEEKKYKKAFNVITSIPQKIMKKDIDWQLLYLWTSFENKQKNMSKSYEYMKNVQANVRKIDKEKLYHYTLGLYHENKKNYNQAKMAFEKSKIIDPAFPPSYSAIKRCSLQLLKEKQKNQNFLSKLKNLSLDDFKKNKKVS